jgi:hypothetical protein
MDFKKIILKLLYLKFTTVETVPSAQPDLVNIILAQLGEQGYYVLDNSDNRIAFSAYEDKFQVISTNRYSKKLQTGVFEISNVREGTTVKLSYFISIFSEIFLFIAFLIISLLTNYWVFILTIILVVRIIVKANKLKAVAKYLMFEVIKNR